MRKIILVLLLLVAGCTAPGYNDDYGPEVVLDDAVHHLASVVEGDDEHDARVEPFDDAVGQDDASVG